MAGKYFEELQVGQTFRHEVGRTITEADNVFFSTLTMNPQPLHIDFHAAAKAEFGKPLVNSLLTLGIAVGVSVGETTLGTTVGNLGFDKIEFPKMARIAELVYATASRLANLDHMPARDNLGPRRGKGSTGPLPGVE